MESLRDLKDMLNSQDVSSRRLRLQMNIRKTKIVHDKHVSPSPVTVNGAIIGVLQEYIYLGQIIQLGSHKFDRYLGTIIDRRIHLGLATYGKLFVRMLHLRFDNTAIMNGQGIKPVRPIRIDICSRER